MSLGLHKKCLQRLSEKIAQRLPEIEVKNRMFLDYWTVMLRTAGKILPQTETFKNKLEQYISETPVHDFICETLSRELRENQKYDTESQLLPLTQLAGYSDAKVTAERLIQDFESLPWEYSLLVEFANDFGELFAKSVKDCPISDSVTLVTPDEYFAKEFPLKSGIEARDQGLAYLSYWPSSENPSLGSIANFLSVPYSLQKSDKTYSYLQLKVSGFIGYYGDTSPWQEAISLLKTFCGIGIALRLLKVKYTYHPVPTRAKFIVHRRIGSNWIIESVRELEVALSDTFHDLTLHDLDGRIKAEEAEISWIQARLKLIGCVFRHRKEAEKIILASQWLFDSYCGNNELLSFVQTTVVLEILLGDKMSSDAVGLQRLLSNRCAYLIGDGQKQREEILRTI